MRKLALLIFFLAGCSTHTLSPPSQVICWNHNIEYGARFWQIEAEQHFHRPVIIFVCHGSSNKDNVWMCYPDKHSPVPVEAAARLLHDMSGGRPVVLIVCNDGKADIHVPNVWYAHQMVWSAPGALNDFRWLFYGDEEKCASSMKDFVEGR